MTINGRLIPELDLGKYRFDYFGIIITKENIFNHKVSVFRGRGESKYFMRNPTSQ